MAKDHPLPPIAICIPVRNEAGELPGLFAALDRLDRAGPSIVRVCLLLDGCSDDSAALAHAWRARTDLSVTIAAVVTATANAGVARHRAMMLGLALLDGGGDLVLTTDADSQPSPAWLAAMTSALDQADIVAGRIVRAGARPNALQDRIEAYYDALFVVRRHLDPVPWEAIRTHHHAGGANMGFRAAVYRELGGFPPLACGEDARLIDDASRAGWRVRRDAASVVHTSDRRDGRAVGGLALALRQCDASDDAAIQVAHPGDAAWQYRMQAAARAAYAAKRLDEIAAPLGLTLDHVSGVAGDCPNSEAFAMRIVPAPPTGMRAVTLPVAEAILARLLDERRAA